MVWAVVSERKKKTQETQTLASLSSLPHHALTHALLSVRPHEHMHTAPAPRPPMLAAATRGATRLAMRAGARPVGAAAAAAAADVKLGTLEVRWIVWEKEGRRGRDRRNALAQFSTSASPTWPRQPPAPRPHTKSPRSPHSFSFARPCPNRTCSLGPPSRRRCPATRSKAARSAKSRAPCTPLSTPRPPTPPPPLWPRARARPCTRPARPCWRRLLTWRP